MKKVSDLSPRLPRSMDQSEQLYRDLVEGMPALVCRFLPNGTLVYVNEQYCHYFGKTRLELDGYNFFEFIPEQEHAYIRQQLQSLTRSNPVESHTQMVILADGSQRWQRWTNRAIFDQQGQIAEYQAFGEDITEHHLAVEALRQSETKFRRMIEQFHEGIALTDEQGLIIEWNRAMEQITGLSASQALGKPIWDVQYQLAPPDKQTPASHQELKNQIELALQTGESAWLGQMVEHVFTLVDGEQVFAQFVVFPIRTEKGVMLCSITNDISERRLVDAQVRLQSVALEAAANAIVITNLGGKIIWANSAFTRLTGYSLEEALGASPSLLKSGRHGQEFYQQMWETILGGRVWSGEVTNQRKDGSFYIEEMTITPVTDSMGRISHFIAIKQDITERKRAEKGERAARRQTEMLRQALQALASDLDLEQVLDTLLVYLEKVVPYDAALVLYQERNLLKIKATHGAVDLSRARHECPMEDNPLVQQILGTKKAVVLQDVEQDALGQCWKQLGPFHGCIGLPLLLGGNPIGYLVILSCQPGAYGEEEAAIAQTFTDQATIAIENARLYSRANYLAVTDPLTELYNRRYFFDLARQEIERAQRYSAALSMIMIDLDHFKLINDTYGHIAGDSVLRQVAQRIHQAIRSIDLAARFGGEEFVILMPETPLEGARKVAERLCKEISGAVVEADGEAVQVTASLGVAELSREAADLGSLLKQADAALYRAKAAGRNQVSI
ncbi:MAG: PAS domain S-box protein [Anaerolineales bacterium]|nr:PAS domain S-box protein [Anaerolineales bacterium]